MKIIAFAVREDELIFFKKYQEEFNLNITLKKCRLSEETVELAKDYDMVTFLGNCTVNEIVLKKIKEFGIKYMASRSTGYNNIDLEIAKKLDIKISNATYSPYSVSEFAIMSILMLLRNIPKSLKRINNNNFSLNGLVGRELRNQRIGVIGTGKIGKIVLNTLKCMGAKVIAYDIYPSSKDIEYVSLETLFKKSDVITLHSPLTEENKYIINKTTMNMMKKDVLIVNTARGELVNIEDLILYLEEGKIAGVALDTLEGEVGIFHKDCSYTGFENENLKKLKEMENVLITSHQAFYTEQAVSDMIESALQNLSLYYETGNAPNDLK